MTQKQSPDDAPLTWQRILTQLRAGDWPTYDTLDAVPPGERESAFALLLDDPDGRRWLRAWHGLDAELAARLLAFEEDFRGVRRDATLDAVVARATRDDALLHAAALAAGSAAPAFWRRLRGEPGLLAEIACRAAAGDDRRLAETTLELLVLDPLDPYGLGDATRREIAEAGLRSPFASVRGLAAEYVAETTPDIIVRAFSTLVAGDDERLRAVAWRVAFRHAPSEARDLAFALLGDERVDLHVRRSALLAAGEHLPTDELVDLLSWFVTHPDPDLAGDAADLLHALHRNPLIAEAALHSPHAHVRETAERLMDPLRGSPAAGGSRPGSPADVAALFEDLVRRESERHG
jgi:hypothetical protein